MRRPLRLYVLVLVLALVAGCTGVPAPRISLANVPAAQQARAARNVRVFDAAWRLVAEKHFDPRLHGLDWPALGAKYGAEAAAAKNDQALYAALNAMLDALDDSHTHALPPALAEARRTRERARTGFNATRIEGRWVVSEVLPGTPAQRAGVQPGWMIVSRNGEPVRERLDYQPYIGETADWTFLDLQDRPVTKPLTALLLSTAPRQVVRELPGGLVYLRFDGFDARDRRWLGEQLQAHRAAPGVIIDLRYNPGGETWSLGISLGEFFARKADCGTFTARGGSREIKNSWQLGSARYAGRVAVLVDGGTASAAEIFSAVLQEHGRAVIVGRKSAGAVLASRFYRLPDGGELQLSVEDYVTPKGRRLEGAGVIPDVVSKRTLADLRAGRDPDLAAAMQALTAAGIIAEKPQPTP